MSGKKAMLAVAHKLLTIGYTLLSKREMYSEPDLSVRDARRTEQLAAQMQAASSIRFFIIVIPRSMNRVRFLLPPRPGGP